MIKIFSDGKVVMPIISKFPGGEINVNWPPAGIYYDIGRYVTIYATLETSDDIMALLLVTDSLRRNSALHIERLDLMIPYVPYARQDRVNNAGESLSIKVFADIINAQKYDQVVVWDAHSDVSTALIDRCANLSKEHIFNSLPRNVALVSPDAGALKKTLAFAKFYNIENVLRADKERDTKTGQITGTVVYGKIDSNQDVMMLDDICDGGRTFIELAKELRKMTTGKIYLTVTHGIFSKGLQVLKDAGIDHVFTANMWSTVENDVHNFVTVYNVLENMK